MRGEKWKVAGMPMREFASKCGHWTDSCEMALIMLYYCHLKARSEERADAGAHQFYITLQKHTDLIFPWCIKVFKPEWDFSFLILQPQNPKSSKRAFPILALYFLPVCISFFWVCGTAAVHFLCAFSHTGTRKRSGSQCWHGYEFYMCHKLSKKDPAPKICWGLTIWKELCSCGSVCSFNKKQSGGSKFKGQIFERETSFSKICHGCWKTLKSLK